MALAKKCDRCGGLYEPKLIEIDKQRVNGIMLIERRLDNSGGDNRGYRDFCPDCLNDLVDFLKKPIQVKEGTNA